MDKTKEEQIQDILNDEVDIEGAEETEKTEGKVQVIHIICILETL